MHDIITVTRIELRMKGSRVALVLCMQVHTLINPQRGSCCPVCVCVFL